jgi:hypothetical protein
MDFGLQGVTSRLILELIFRGCGMATGGSVLANGVFLGGPEPGSALFLSAQTN